MTVKKKANELRVGDKILGETNFYIVNSVKNSALTGSIYPVIEIVDSHGLTKIVETGANEKFQDHIYEVELPVVWEQPRVAVEQPAIEETKPVKKAKKPAKTVVKKPSKKVAAKKKAKKAKNKN
jgi:outer membrane biosynthesis protein TonB